VRSTLTQGYVLLSALWSGMALGLAYDIFRAVRRATQAGKAMTAVLDVLFCMLAAGTALLVIYVTGGEARAYLFAAMAGGALLYLAGPGALIRMAAARIAGFAARKARERAGKRTQNKGNIQMPVE
jgi:spore cortex biosynthesis protein YabQ